jgi:glutaredoxin-related protein
MQDRSQEILFPNFRPHDQIVIYLIKIQHVYEEVELVKPPLHVKDFIELRTAVFAKVMLRDSMNLIKVLGPDEDRVLIQDTICVIENNLLARKNAACRGFLGIGRNKSSEEYGKLLWGVQGNHYDRLLVIALKNIYLQIKLANYTVIRNEEIEKFIDCFSSGLEEKFYKEKVEILNSFKLILPY